MQDAETILDIVRERQRARYEEPESRMRGQRASPVRRKADGQGQQYTSPAVDPILRGGWRR